MIKNFIYLVLVAMVCFDTVFPQTRYSFTISETGNSATFTVRAGSPFSISVKGNPTTGYSWFLDHPENLNKRLLIPLNLDKYNSGEFVSNPHPAGMVGVGGTFIFKFRAVRRGLARFKLIYKRPWLPNNPARVVTVTIRIT